MRIGNFEVNELLPELNQPHVIVCLRPWVDCGSVGTLVLQWLETRFEAVEIARLARPGSFYDFTRYRPTTHFRQGNRELVIPNTTITCSRLDTGNDLVFVHLLEPHNLGEIYAGSVWQLLKTLGIKRYCLVGSFYDMVPHTKAIMITGSASNEGLQVALKDLPINLSRYEGPTTICNLISLEAEKAGVETLTLLAHLPQYTELEEDYVGVLAIKQVLHMLYGISIDKADARRAESQLKTIDAVVKRDRKLKALVAELELQYDTRFRMTISEVQEIPLSPEVDQFLKEMENRFKES
jgi:hypothetical protein